MDTFREKLSQIPGLPGKDAIIARSLIRTGWLSEQIVLQAARDAAQDIGGDDLLQRLCVSGQLSPDRAKMVTDALERKLAERRSMTSVIVPETSGVPGPQEALSGRAADVVREDSPEREGTPGRQRTTRYWKPKRDRVQAEDESSIIDIRAGQERERRVSAREFFARYLRSDLAETIMGIVHVEEGELSPDEIAGRVGASRDDVVTILADWRDAGLLKSLGGMPFYFAPSPRRKKEIDRHIEAWNDPEDRERCIETAREEALEEAFCAAGMELASSKRMLSNAQSTRQMLEEQLGASANELISLTQRLEDAKRQIAELSAQLRKARDDANDARVHLALKDQLVQQVMEENRRNTEIVREYHRLREVLDRFERDWNATDDTRRSSRRMRHGSTRMSSVRMRHSSSDSGRSHASLI